MAVANYHDVNGCYPPAYIADAEGNPLHSWRVLILPYIEEQQLFDRYDFTQPWNSPTNLQLASEMPAVYAFHGLASAGSETTNYLAVVGDDTLWPLAAPRREQEITDAPATTILFVENHGASVHWLEPRDLHFQAMDLRVNSPQGISSQYLAPAVVMLDGSLRRLEDDLAADTLRALLTTNGGERLAEEGHGWRLLSDGRLRNPQQPNVDSPP